MFGNKHESESGCLGLEVSHQERAAASDAADQHDSPDQPTLPVGEAAALVARLLSECDQPACVDARGASSGPSPEPAAAVAALFATESAPVADLAVAPKDSDVPNPASATAQAPYSKRSFWLMIALVSVLIFGAGLAVGYGIVGRGWKAASIFSAQKADVSAFRVSGLSQPVEDGNQTSAAKAPGAPPTDAALNLPPMAAAPSSQGATRVAAKTGVDKNLERPADQPRTARSEQIHSVSATSRAPADTTGLDKSLASIEAADAATRAANTTLHETAPIVHPPMSASETSTQSVHAGGAAPAPAQAYNMLPASEAPWVAGTTASSGAISSAPEAQDVDAGPSDEPSKPTAASAGQIEPCQLVHSVQPIYPEKAKQVGVEGDVQLRVVVAVDGSVRYVGLVSGPQMLVMAAIDAAREFRYKPAMLNGKPIETVQSVKMAFKLKN
jgi:TonB family protein